MLAWSPELLRPYESGWALMERFQALNRPTLRDLHALVGRVGMGNAVFAHKSCFDSSAAFQQEKLERVLGVPKARFEDLFTGYHGLDLFNRGDFQLRYCTDCMRMGFHSPLYQATALWRCPIHKKELRDSCPVCDGPIGYDLPRKSRDRFFACSEGHPLMNADDLKSLLAPLPEPWIATLDDFTRTTRRVAADRRRLHWVFDHDLHPHADRRAFWLFAQVIGAGDEFLRHFYKGQRVRMSVMGKSDMLPASTIVDWELNGNYEHDMLLRARRWFRLVENPTRSTEFPFSGRVGRTRLEAFYKHAWGVSAADAARSAESWVDFWTRNPGNWVTADHTGALWGVAYPIVAAHRSRSRAARLSQDDDYLIDERIYRWAYRKVMTALFVATYRLNAKIDRWVGDDYMNQTRLPSQMGLWAFPRCYLLVGKGDAALMVMEPDYGCPLYRASIHNEPDPAVRHGGRRFLDYVDKKLPPFRMPRARAGRPAWPRPVAWPAVTEWDPGKITDA